jgi:hypothetical protein
MNLLDGTQMARAGRARDRRATLAAQRRTQKGRSIIRLYRGPLAKVAWIFGVGR